MSAASDTRDARAGGRPPRVLIASPVFPYPQSAGNAMRVSQTHEALRELGCEVIFVFCPAACIARRGPAEATRDVFGDQYAELSEGLPDSSIPQRLLERVKAALGRRCPDWLRDFVFVDGFVRRRGAREFAATVAAFRADAVILEYAVLSRLATALPPAIPVLLDTHDVFSHRNRRLRGEGSDALWWSLLPRQEARALRRASAVLAIQVHEERFFVESLGLPRDKVSTIDILQPPVGASSQREAGPGAPVIGFFGSRNGHNTEGLRRFLDGHWADLRSRLPGVRLLLAGSIALDERFRGTEAVDCLGLVDSPSDFYDRVDLVVNPCPSGSGLKIKSVEALAHGRPLVTTAEGALGLEHYELPAMRVAALGSGAFTEACLDALSNAGDAAAGVAATVAALDGRAREVRGQLSVLVSPPTSGHG